jgi:predicted transposase YbfD/YdcC
LAGRTPDCGHGREEERYVTVIYDLPGLPAERPNVATVVLVARKRGVKGANASTAHYYLTSRRAKAAPLGRAIRGHWEIENGLRWVLGVAFREHDNHTRGGHAGVNLRLVRRLAPSLLGQDPAKGSIKSKRLSAALDDDYFLQVLQGFPENLDALALRFQEQLQDEFALIAAEGDDQAIQAPLGPKLLGVHHDLGQGECQPKRGAGQQSFGLAGDDVPDFPHTVSDQVLIHFLGDHGQDSPGQGSRCPLRETEDQGAFGRGPESDDCGNITQRIVHRLLIHGPDDHFSAGHFAQCGTHAGDERLKEFVPDLLGDRLRAFDGGFKPVQDNLLHHPNPQSTN